jgi:nucleoside-diphosphate-sugar epimerase
VGSRLVKAFNGEGFLTIPHEMIPRAKLGHHQRLYFCSAYGNLAHQKDARAMARANIVDPIILSVQQPASRFVYLSTSSVSLRTQTDYSLTKAAAELALSSHDNCAIIRLYSVTGVGEQDCHLIPTLIDAALTGKTIPFYPDATHDFIDVEDVVRAMIDIGNRTGYGLYELGRGASVSNAVVKDMVEQITGKQVNTTPFEGRAYDCPDWVCKQPTVEPSSLKSLDQSITEMVEAYVASGKTRH